MLEGVADLKSNLGMANIYFKVISKIIDMNTFILPVINNLCISLTYPNVERLENVKGYISLNIDIAISNMKCVYG